MKRKKKEKEKPKRMWRKKISHELKMKKKKPTMIYKIIRFFCKIILWNYPNVFIQNIFCRVPRK